MGGFFFGKSSDFRGPVITVTRLILCALVSLDLEQMWSDDYVRAVGGILSTAAYVKDEREDWVEGNVSLQFRWIQDFGSSLEN